jgi:hypothetical protein
MGPDQETRRRIVTTRAVRAWLDEEGILHVETLPAIEHKKADAEELLARLWEIADRRRRPLLVDLTRCRGIDREARLCYAGARTGAVSAVALIVGSPLTRAIGHFFIGINKPPRPTRIFSSEPEAIPWLRTFA